MFAAEEVILANNSLKAKLLSSNHIQPLIPPRSQVEALQINKQNKQTTLSLGQKLAAKFRRRKEQKLERTPNETAAAQDAQQMNEEGQERNFIVGPSLA